MRYTKKFSFAFSKVFIFQCVHSQKWWRIFLYVFKGFRFSVHSLAVPAMFVLALCILTYCDVQTTTTVSGLLLAINFYTGSHFAHKWELTISGGNSRTKGMSTCVHLIRAIFCVMSAWCTWFAAASKILYWYSFCTQLKTRHLGKTVQKWRSVTLYASPFDERHASFLQMIQVNS